MSEALPRVAVMNPAALQEEISGAVLTAHDNGWDAARTFHSGIGEPELVVRAASVDDVRAAVRHAAAAGAPIVVRGGGHSAWASLPGGLALDLRDLDAVAVDGTRVSVGGGATWGAVAAALAEHGLAISSGDTASVGVGGLTLGGGIGWMTRAWGLAIDQLVGAQVVTAAGELVEASADAEPELFWALRGGGGNFGVVTRFDFEAHRLPEVVHAVLTVPADPRETLRVLRDLLHDAPRELTVTYMDVPAMDPSAPAGASLTAVWAGSDPDAARAALAPLLALDGVDGDVEAIRYVDVLAHMPGVEETGQVPPGFIGGNALVRDLDDATIDGLIAFRRDYPGSVVFLRSLGGAYSDVPEEATAFSGRAAGFFVMAGAFDIPQLVDDATRARAAADWERIAAPGIGLYGNFIADAKGGLIERMHAPETLARLRGLKRRWDPQNLFSRNHNIAP